MLKSLIIGTLASFSTALDLRAQSVSELYQYTNEPG